MRNNTRKFLILLLILMLEFIAPAYAASNPYYIFSGNANKSLAQTIAYHLRTPLGNAQIERYSDGEINIKINEEVKNKSVFIVQSICKGNNSSINDSVMELYLLTRALKRSGAKTITAVIPYLGYTQQDRKDFNYAPIITADIARLLENTGINNIITVDLHSIQIQGFFHSLPIENLYASSVIAPYFANLGLKNPAVVAIHSSGILRTENFKDHLATIGIKSDLALIIKHLSNSTMATETNLIGKVKGRDVIIVDVVCNTGNTLIEAAKTLKAAGALNIYAVVTHPLLSINDVLEKLAGSEIKEIVITDTIPIEKKLPHNVRLLSVAPLLAEIIRNRQ